MISDYLRDESRLEGWAESALFPEHEEQLRGQLQDANDKGVAVTVQGARTGIAGGAVPRGGQIVNLSRMRRIRDVREHDGGFLLRAQPGVTLAELRAALARGDFNSAFDPAKPLFFAPDPTETSASLGGMAASNASGACSFCYGPMRAHIQSVRIALADGGLARAARGAPRAQGRRFALPVEAGHAPGGALPAYDLPNVKNAAGYYVRDDMDLMDLFIGSEGTLGIATELELKLLPAPPVCWGLLMFFPCESAAIEGVLMVRERQGGARAARRETFDLSCLSARAQGALAAMEFFDAAALDLLREQKKANPSFAGGLPALPREWHTGLYLEYHADSESAAERAVLEASSLLTRCGGDDSASWLAADPRETSRQKEFRHAVPEAVNLTLDGLRKNDPGIAKLGTDLAVPDPCLPHILDLYEDGLRDTGLHYVKFGHIGDNHLHINILPRTRSEYDSGRRLYRQWASAATEMGGTVSAEHGVGKLKADLLAIMYGAEGVAQMQALKKLFDPRATLNRGNLFD